jgi:hypothetical protein
MRRLSRGNADIYKIYAESFRRAHASLVSPMQRGQEQP